MTQPNQAEEPKTADEPAIVKEMRDRKRPTGFMLHDDSVGDLLAYIDSLKYTPPASEPSERDAAAVEHAKRLFAQHCTHLSGSRASFARFTCGQLAALLEVSPEQLEKERGSGGEVEQERDRLRSERNDYFAKLVAAQQELSELKAKVGKAASLLNALWLSANNAAAIGGKNIALDLLLPKLRELAVTLGLEGGPFLPHELSKLQPSAQAEPSPPAQPPEFTRGFLEFKIAHVETMIRKARNYSERAQLHRSLATLREDLAKLPLPTMRNASPPAQPEEKVPTVGEFLQGAPAPKATEVAVCVCGHLRQAHAMRGGVLACVIAGCACGPGCIHEGFVDSRANQEAEPSPPAQPNKRCETLITEGARSYYCDKPDGHRGRCGAQPTSPDSSGSVDAATREGAVDSSRQAAEIGGGGDGQHTSTQPGGSGGRQGERCDQCGGAGKYLGPGGWANVTCSKCKGSGVQPEAREADKLTELERRVDEAATKTDALLSKHPPQPERLTREEIAAIRCARVGVGPSEERMTTTTISVGTLRKLLSAADRDLTHAEQSATATTPPTGPKPA